MTFFFTQKKKKKKSGHLLLLLVRRLHNVLFFIFGFFGVYDKTFCGVCVLDQLTKKIKITIGRYYWIVSVPKTKQKISPSNSRPIWHE